jgi:hypothetical protein
MPRAEPQQLTPDNSAASGRAIPTTRLVPRAFADLSHAAARAFLVLLGAAALAWGAYTLPMFWRQSSIERTARHIIYGDRFKAEALFAMMPEIEAAEQAEICRPTALRAAAILRLRVSELAFDDGDRSSIPASIEPQLSALRDSIRRSLACSPADPFLWVVLYWVENTRVGGFRPDYLEYLRLSYRLGPNEGWVGAKRNGLAFAVFEQLPPDVADMALAEFANLLKSGFYGEAITTFTGPGWRVRDLLLPRLKGVAERHRQAFSRALYALGYNVVIPGIQNPDPRPWH